MPSVSDRSVPMALVSGSPVTHTLMGGRFEDLLMPIQLNSCPEITVYDSAPIRQHRVQSFRDSRREAMFNQVFEKLLIFCRPQWRE